MKTWFAILLFISSTQLFCQTGNMTDPRDGKVYKTVQIGSKVWMAQNLVYAKSLRFDPANEDGEYIFCYEDSDANCEKYGMLYSWKAAMKSCPSGWHLPSKSEFDSLFHSLGSTKTNRYLKVTQVLNDSNDTLAGWLYMLKNFPDGTFRSKGRIGGYWTSSEHQRWEAQRMFINGKQKKAWITSAGKRNAFSVRCIKD